MNRAARGDVIYWEKQGRDRMCALHCMNSLLQGPEFSEVDFGQIASDLDKKERELMAAGGISSDDYKNFMAEGSGNAALDGYFSWNVMEEALRKKGLQAIQAQKPEMQVCMRDPTLQEAFICHQHDHWYAIRKIRGAWYNLDSLKPAPAFISDFYLAAFLQSLQAEGKTIYVVVGPLQSAARPQTMTSSHPNAFWLTRAEMEEMARKAEESQKEEARKANEMVNGPGGGGGGGDGEGAPSFGYVQNPRAQAAQHSWPTGQGQRLDGGGGGAPSGPGAGAVPGLPPGMEAEDPELAQAIALSMQSFQKDTAQREPPPEEPPAGAQKVTSIQVRAPNGERLQRRFLIEQPVSVIFQWLEFYFSQKEKENVFNPPLGFRSYSLNSSYPKRKFVKEGGQVVLFEGGQTEGVDVTALSIEGAHVAGEALNLAA
uniref:ubiquitinyl hydrolase 1 n=1 Tax=Chromera velia CCMP2878 TaxID=1169474 RepID=A0A0G4F1P0_9ALVE|eukprot:Cvel_14681.t1-p1 / transcript=Cvel_14681.t1 / gene=Cvel_14681 / organism=Chromera_velia_CCMP2878 / gene_product=Ataxin-3 homolog, putative / transcript_product=Ataxin-3 homolog, putative / location=Cvel_scaffold1053:16967-21465(+) / protein_length=427 / sequence_SO=supercontig / SO=protein_coding / is_pseudo=false